MIGNSLLVGGLIASWLFLPGCEKPVLSPVADLPSLAGLTMDPTRSPSPPTILPTAVSLSQILCYYRGTEESLPYIRWSRKQARMRAEHLLILARSQGQIFSQLATQYSNDSKTTLQGGDMGIIVPGDLHPDLERAGFSLDLGQVSDIIETPRGFHILYRSEPTQAQVAEIVIAYQDAKRYVPITPRSRKQAQYLAETIWSQLQKDASFPELARLYSDLPNAEAGGFYPIFKKGTQLAQFEQIVFALKEGEWSAVVETPTGFHIVKRYPIQKALIRVIEIGYGPEQAKKNIPQRSPEEALLLAEKILQSAQEPQSDFVALVASYSDSATRESGGLQGPFGHGEIPYQVETLAFGLNPGELSLVTDIPGRVLLIKRVR